MRKLIVTNIMSLDGYFEGPGNNVMALPMDPAFDRYNLDRLNAADTVLFGGSTYTGFKEFWPAIPDNQDVSEVTRETGRRINEIAKVVVSDSITDDDTAPWSDTTTIVRRADAERAIADLKGQEGGDIVVFGSHVLWNSLLAAGLVDELHLILGSTVLGGGTPIFDGPVEGLTQLEARRFEGSNNVLLRYAAAH